MARKEKIVGPADVLRRALTVLKRCYGPRSRPGRSDPVGMLVATILSQNTSNANSSLGYERLRAELPTWDAVADAPVGKIERCIRPAGLGRTKAPRIRAILREIRRKRGRIELDYLDEMSDDQAVSGLAGVQGRRAEDRLVYADVRDGPKRVPRGHAHFPHRPPAGRDGRGRAVRPVPRGAHAADRAAESLRDARAADRPRPGRVQSGSAEVRRMQNPVPLPARASD